MPLNSSEASKFCVLDVRVDAVQIPEVVRLMEGWIAEPDRCRYVTVTGMHGIMEAHHEPTFKTILNSADLVVPDGMPLVWLGRIRGFALRRRVYGPEMMWHLFHETDAKSYRHFFYGGASGVPEKLVERLRRAFPNFKNVGIYSPPFRPLTADEDAAVVEMINKTRADILWVGLSTPKQERWMYEHRERLKVPVLVGVGAAFDFHAGMKTQAPEWMREHGLEWLYRLFQEPQRLWRRYLVYGSEFICLTVLEQLGVRKTR